MVHAMDAPRRLHINKTIKEDKGPSQLGKEQSAVAKEVIWLDAAQENRQLRREKQFSDWE